MASDREQVERASARWGMLAEAACTAVATVAGVASSFVALHPYEGAEEPLSSRADADAAALIVWVASFGVVFACVAEVIAWRSGRGLRGAWSRGLRLGLLALFAWRFFDAWPAYSG